jgi:hypothetical protein
LGQHRLIRSKCDGSGGRTDVSRCYPSWCKLWRWTERLNDYPFWWQNWPSKSENRGICRLYRKRTYVGQSHTWILDRLSPPCTFRPLSIRRHLSPSCPINPRLHDPTRTPQAKPVLPRKPLSIGNHPGLLRIPISPCMATTGRGRDRPAVMVACGSPSERGSSASPRSAVLLLLPASSHKHQAVQSSQPGSYVVV